MSARFVLTLQAARDLAAIAAHVEREGSSEAAESVVLELVRAFQLLAERPGIGHVRDELSTESTVRFWVVLSYLIAFIPTETPVPILAIAHGSRDPDAIARELRDALRRQFDA